MEAKLPGFAVAADVAVEGPALQVAVPIAWPATIAASGTFTSGVVPTFGMPHVAVGATLSNAGTLIVQPYLDTAGAVAAGAATTQALTANTGAVLDLNSGKVMGSLTVEIVNGAASVGTLTNPIGVLQAR